MKNMSIKNLSIIASILFITIIVLTNISINKIINKPEKSEEITNKPEKTERYLKIKLNVSNILNEIINENNTNDTLLKQEAKNFFIKEATVKIMVGKTPFELKKIKEYLLNISLHKNGIIEINVQEIILDNNNLINEIILNETWKTS